MNNALIKASIKSQLYNDRVSTVRVQSINDFIRGDLENYNLKDTLNILEQTIIESGSTEMHLISVYVNVYTNSRTKELKDFSNSEVSKYLKIFDLIFYYSRRLFYDIIFRRKGYHAISGMFYRNRAEGYENRFKNKGNLTLGLYPDILESILLTTYVYDKEKPIYVSVIKVSDDQLAHVNIKTPL